MGELVADIVGLLELGDKAESLVSEFSCTEESLTRWFRESALRWQKSDMCRVFVVLDGNGATHLSPRRHQNGFISLYSTSRSFQNVWHQVKSIGKRVLPLTMASTHRKRSWSPCSLKYTP